MKCTNGLSLIELLLSLALSTLIFTGIITIYLAVQKNFLVQSALMTIQDNIRLSFPTVAASLRTAGSLSCMKLIPEIPMTNHSSSIFTYKNKLTPYKNAEMKAETDGITIRQSSASQVTLTQNMLKKDVLSLTNNILFHENDILMISDCKTVDIFVVKKVLASNHHTQQITPENPLSKCYPELSEISRVESNSYYIAKTSRLNEKNMPIYALYINDIRNRRTELIEGVDDMQIDYAVLINGQIHMRKAFEILQWQDIQAVSIRFNFTSLNTFSVSKPSYLYVALRE